MKVLIGCEFSGTVRDAFLRRGHEAVSCDFLPTEVPGPHIVGDVREALERNKWDAFIVFPTCTYLCGSGLHWNKRRPERAAQTEEALEFARFLLSRYPRIPRVALENPIGCISSRIRKPDQIIHPWMFGHPESKATCLWLEGLEPLEPTNILEPSRWVCCGRVLPAGVGKYGCANCNGEKVARPRWDNQTDSGQNRLAPSEDRWKLRSTTYAGIAEAMASQWGGE